MEWYQRQNQDSKCTSSIDDLHEVYKFYHHLINMKPPCKCNKKKDWMSHKRKLHQRDIVFNNLIHLNVFENSVNDFSNGNVSLILPCFPQSIVCKTWRWYRTCEYFYNSIWCIFSVLRLPPSALATSIVKKSVFLTWL